MLPVQKKPKRRTLSERELKIQEDINKQFEEYEKVHGSHITDDQISETQMEQVDKIKGLIMERTKLDKDMVIPELPEL